MDKDSLKVLLKANEGSFYVYQLSRPDGTPFYIGKGIRTRVFGHELEAQGPKNSHKLNIIRKINKLGHSIDYEIVSFFDDEVECHQFEIDEISRIGRYDLGTGPLTNLTDGGEGAVGLSDETRARMDFNLHSQDAPGERGVANRFYSKLCDTVRSIPIRPVNETAKPRALSAFDRTNQKPSPRQAAALAGSAIANGVLLEPGALLPRRLMVNDVDMIIEYGVCKNILQSGMACLAAEGLPAHEELELTELGFNAICQHLDAEILISAGVLMPNERA